MKTIRTKDYNGKAIDVVVSDEVYEAWNESHREVDRVHKSEVRHRDFTDLDTVALTHPASTYEDLSELVVQQEQILLLYEAIASLTPLQQRRIRMFMDNLTYQQIADIEGRNKAVIFRSLEDAFRNLRKYMEK